jgi:hypothetical protein
MLTVQMNNNMILKEKSVSLWVYYITTKQEPGIFKLLKNVIWQMKWKCVCRDMLNTWNTDWVWRLPNWLPLESCSFCVILWICSPDESHIVTKICSGTAICRNRNSWDCARCSYVVYTSHVTSFSIKRNAVMNPEDIWEVCSFWWRLLWCFTTTEGSHDALVYNIITIIVFNGFST